MRADSADGGSILNADVSWDEFDPDEYMRRNYLHLQCVDLEIIQIMSRHFGDHFGAEFDPPRSGIDVGTGSNLYPALAMLPWCGEITFLERSASNVDYLQRQVPGYDAHWDQFWAALRQHKTYEACEELPRRRFRQAVRVRPGCLFDLTERQDRWSMGTMFFVAESITTSLQEFHRAVACFVGALSPGAPFVAGFMEDSLGYRVGDAKFPACCIDSSRLLDSLSPFADELDVVRTGNHGSLVRDGYRGILVARGFKSFGAG
ncbi:SCO2525 family SAM-dependent methyltransferase [Streptomyces sp. NBC_01235]|uniref:SCO2525 family SAM-dependent methyltransferase n=1 Tax=Streptomyces sp. NBC_01235 TaxID=2903788 RepID=UPI002E100924|nr:SCO2525 family SAM-dependent methyltransferase [Streptomyces sp. NBC_01235]